MNSSETLKLNKDFKRLYYRGKCIAARTVVVYILRNRLGRNRIGLTCFEPKGAFYVFPDISKYGIPSWEFCTRMIREGRLAAVPGVCFGAEGYIRLSYCYSDGELKAGLDNMEAFLKGL